MNYIPDAVYGAYSEAQVQSKPPRMVNAGTHCPHCNTFILYSAVERCSRCGMELPMKPAVEEVVLRTPTPKQKAALAAAFTDQSTPFKSTVATAIFGVGTLVSVALCLIGGGGGIVAALVLMVLAYFLASIVEEVGVMPLVVLGAVAYFGVTGMRGCAKAKTPYQPGNIISWNGAMYRVVQARAKSGCVVDVKTGNEINPFYWNDKVFLVQ